MQKIIKRYQNRKLYDTQTSRYVTLDDIATMICRGEDVAVLDNKNNRDITSSTLTQIIFEKEKKSKSFIPIHILRDIIKSSGGSISSFIGTVASGALWRKTVKSSVREITSVKDEIQRRIEDVTGVFHLHKEIEELQQKVSQLQKKLTVLRHPAQKAARSLRD